MSARLRLVDGSVPAELALANDADVATIAADLARVASVALDFPKWNDGRAYSQARLLRARYRFNGEIRATGQVLVDMLPLLVRWAQWRCLDVDPSASSASAASADVKPWRIVGGRGAA